MKGPTSMSPNIIAYRQDSFSYLCGLMAVINATRMATRDCFPLKHDDCATLYFTLINDLHERGILVGTITNGIGIHGECRLLRLTDSWLADGYGYRLNYRRPWARKAATPDMQTVLAEIKAHLMEPHTAVLAWVYGTIHHWSMIKSVDDERIALFDSAGYKSFPIDDNVHAKKAACRTVSRLGPSWTFFVTCKPK